MAHVEPRINLLTGEIYLMPRSISFAAMSEDEFIRFRDRCLYILGQVLGVDPVTLMDEVGATQRSMQELEPD